MTALDAIEIIFPCLGGSPTVLATGYICRSAQKAGRRPGNFYMIGSMGMASSIGLGLALSLPKKKIVVVDGDGAVLMNLGNLPMTGALQPSNFLHIVLDNEAYESTGNQTSLSCKIRLDRIAESSGYAWTAFVRSAADLKKNFPRLLKKKGPGFLLVKVSCDTRPASTRVEDSPEEITRRFRESLRPKAHGEALT